MYSNYYIGVIHKDKRELNLCHFTRNRIHDCQKDYISKQAKCI